MESWQFFLGSLRALEVCALSTTNEQYILKTQTLPYRMFTPPIRLLVTTIHSRGLCYLGFTPLLRSRSLRSLRSLREPPVRLLGVEPAPYEIVLVAGGEAPAVAEEPVRVRVRVRVGVGVGVGVSVGVRVRVRVRVRVSCSCRSARPPRTTAPRGTSAEAAARGCSYRPRRSSPSTRP